MLKFSLDIVGTWISTSCLCKRLLICYKYAQTSPSEVTQLLFIIFQYGVIKEFKITFLS
jgi:hypothetical protein